MSYLDGQRYKLIFLATQRGDDKSAFKFRSSEERAVWDRMVAQRDQEKRDREDGIVTYADAPGDWN